MDGDRVTLQFVPGEQQGKGGMTAMTRVPMRNAGRWLGVGSLLLVSLSVMGTPAGAGFASDLGIGIGGGYTRLGTSSEEPSTGPCAEIRLLYAPDGPYWFAVIGDAGGTMDEQDGPAGDRVGLKVAVYRDLISQGDVRPYAGFAAGYARWYYTYDLEEHQEGTYLFQHWESPDRSLLEGEAILGARLFLGSHFCFDAGSRFTKPTHGHALSFVLGLAVLF